jgi:acetolactate synthase-1/2/3 large subunit
MTQITAAQLLVQQLKQHKVNTIFCVPGESYLRALDALYDERDSIRLITARQEGGAAYMAEAYGKLTGRPGICFVTRGPGASNASIGVHTAKQDSTPLILFVGQVPRGQLGREAFQEVDYKQMFGGVAKWVEQIDDGKRIPEIIGRAFQVATSGRPGPVVIALPEDMQGDEVESDRVGLEDRRGLNNDQDLAGRLRENPRGLSRTAPSPEDLEKLQQLLSNAHRPILIVGREGWTLEGIADLREWVAAIQIPVVAAVRAQDMIDNHASHYIGYLGVGANPKLVQRIKESDLILAVGTRLDGLSTQGYTLLDVPHPKQKFVQVYPDPSELGRIYQGELLIEASLTEFARVVGRGAWSVGGEKWKAWLMEGRKDYEEYQRVVSAPGEVNTSEIVTWLRRRLPADSVITTGAGNYTSWVHRFYEWSVPRTQLGPVNGAMGYGVPAAIAAKIVHPERTVVSFAGDGCFLMNGQELATAMQYNLPIIFIVINNSMYGTIRMHQERNFPKRVHGTTLINPNFADYAKAFGAQGEVVDRTEDFAAAFERAVAANKPALIELRVSGEAILPGKELSNVGQVASA